jgi:uncharacterized protein YbaR (Trm112 family)
MLRHDALALLIVCPITRKPVLTGLFMNRKSFRKESIDNGKLLCPHCGQVHVWSKKDAHLAGESR